MLSDTDVSATRDWKGRRITPASLGVVLSGPRSPALTSCFVIGLADLELVDKDRARAAEQTEMGHEVLQKHRPAGMQQSGHIDHSCKPIGESDPQTKAARASTSVTAPGRAGGGISIS